SREHPLLEKQTGSWLANPARALRPDGVPDLGILRSNDGGIVHGIEHEHASGPGRTTRAISAIAVAGSPMCCTTRSARTASKVASSKPSASAPPTSNSIRDPPHRSLA